MENNYPFVYQHATWLGVNPIQGCPKRCKYCFLQSLSKTGVKPEILVSPEETIRLIFESKFYSEEVPLGFFTNTDAFATKNNINYLKRLIQLCDENNLYNPKTLITKCRIPEEFIDFLQKYINKGHKFIIYLSYSGLDSTIERGVIHKHIRENFVKLHQKGIPVIHYWRPLVPENSSNEKLNEVLNFVSQYSLASVIAGIKVEKSYLSKLDFWPELEELADEVVNAEGVWPKNTVNFFNNLPQKYRNYPIYRSNSCALSYALNQADRNAFYGTDICHSNNCPTEHRELCSRAYRDKNISDEYLNKLLLNLGLDPHGISYEYINGKNKLVFHNIELSVADQSYLTQMLQSRVSSSRPENDIYWNTSVNGKRPLFI